VTSYPTGIPTIRVPKNVNVRWTQPGDIPYKGLLKVRVIPPRDIKIPILPLKLDDRLLFVRCIKCARQFKKECTRTQHECTHSDAERAFTLTTTSISLEVALREGYVVDEFHRAWEWLPHQWDDDLFKPYVRLFLKLKVVF
jgi:hypothetical protein